MFFPDLKQQLRRKSPHKVKVADLLFTLYLHQQNGVFPVVVE